MLYQGCLRSSPCPAPAGKEQQVDASYCLIVTSRWHLIPGVSKKLELHFRMWAGRTDTLFSGVYVKQPLPGLIAISVIGGF